MSESLEGSAGIVTGAASGIGAHLAGAFTEAGAKVALFDSDADGVREAASRLGDESLAFEVDVSVPEAVESAVAAVDERFGRLDFIVNNAGIRQQQTFLEHSLEGWRRTIDVNLTGTFLCAQAAARLMVARGGGKILNIASIAGILAMRTRPAYVASKAGIIGLTKAIACELGASGVRCNAIAPGVIETPLTASYFEDADFAELIVSNTPSARWGSPSDLAPAAIFLCSDASDFIQGQILAIDGGWTSGKGY